MRTFNYLFYTLFFLSFFFACSPPTPAPTIKKTPTLTNVQVIKATASLNQPAIAITIDDLPGISAVNYQEMTDKLLTTLKNYQVPAIGFVNENKLYSKNKLNTARLNLLEDWLAAGMELGNHTYSHPDYNRLTFEQFIANIIKGEFHTKRLHAKYGQKMRYFRHPFLHTGNTTEKKTQLEQFLANRQYEIAPVTIDNSEWIFAKAYYIALRKKDGVQMKKIGEAYVDYMKDKTIFYETQSKMLFDRPIKHTLLIHANALNADYLDELLAMYQERNYAFISLEEALTDEAYQSKDEYAGRGGITWLHRWAMTQKIDKAFFKGEPACPEFIQEIAGIQE
ncbi:MAG: polysaccharide deacetylase family protein [Saprospiraceae bacterium]